MSWNIRRVVTGRNAAGRSVVLSDGAPPGAAYRGGYGHADLWSLPAGPLHPESGGERAPGETDLEPPRGAMHWRLLRLPPSDTPAHPPQEELERDPRFDARRPGMHRTDTIDWITVFEGEIELLLDDGRVRLGAGDCVIQRGTWHAWRVVGECDCVFGALLLRSVAGDDSRFEGPGPRTGAAPQGVGPRRVVTHLGGDGRSLVVHDGEPANVLRLEQAPGMAYSDIWQTLGPVVSPAAGGDAPPGPFEFYALGGGVAWKHMVIPPDAALAEVDAGALAAEYAERAPGMASGGEHDPGRPGRHRSDSVDLVQILSGRITLMLDEDEVDLGPGDLVVQRGTWHAWSNRGDEPCVMQAMMVATEPLAGGASHPARAVS
ncbi:MAG: cupin domain-containing protein [Myxococcota bacterium]|nr:cupin domain-containing protein [Myxococcota bacterium]